MKKYEVLIEAFGLRFKILKEAGNIHELCDFFDKYKTHTGKITGIKEVEPEVSNETKEAVENFFGKNI